ncbi:Putative PHD-finger domain containing protein family [Zea mays]|nr:Putative PHD-finger domain containing protein family [Zea mays]
MNTKGFGTTPQHKAYCGKHSVQQKEADAQQYGPEELTSMKRMRLNICFKQRLVMFSFEVSDARAH